jgi:hypothetical protein
LKDKEIGVVTNFEDQEDEGDDGETKDKSMIPG